MLFVAREEGFFVSVVFPGLALTEEKEVHLSGRALVYPPWCRHARRAGRGEETVSGSGSAWLKPGDARRTTMSRPRLADRVWQWIVRPVARRSAWALRPPRPSYCQGLRFHCHDPALTTATQQGIEVAQQKRRRLMRPTRSCVKPGILGGMRSVPSGPGSLYKAYCMAS